VTASPRVRALSIHADSRCRDTGACCTSGWAIPVEPEIEERLRAGLRGGALRPAEPEGTPGDLGAPVGLTGESAPDTCFRGVTGLPHGSRVVLRTDDAGRCAFFDPRRRPSGLCAVHGGLGEDALPSPCRHFPRVVTLTPLGVSVTLSHYCPTAAGMLFRSVVPGPDPRGAWVAPGDPALRIVEGPPAFPAEWPYEGLDARDALPPLLRPGVLMDWPSLERWERFAVSVLGEDGRSPEAALDVLESTAEAARRWTPKEGPFDAFFGRQLEEAPRGETHRSRPASQELQLSLPIRRWLAARAFGSWIALQGDGLRTTVAFLRVALGVLRREASGGGSEAGRAPDAVRLREAFRRADLRLVHLADPEALARRLSRCEARPP
jgi:hypothetical protein